MLQFNSTMHFFELPADEILSYNVHTIPDHSIKHFSHQDYVHSTCIFISVQYLYKWQWLERVVAAAFELEYSL